MINTSQSHNIFSTEIVVISQFKGKHSKRIQNFVCSSVNVYILNISFAMSLCTILVLATVLVLGLLKVAAHQVLYVVPEGGMRHYKAIPAECEATPEVVNLSELIKTIERNVLYTPTCTRLHRCTGCFEYGSWKVNHTVTRRMLSMAKSLYNTTTGRYEPLDPVPLSVEEHSNCRLVCDIKCKETRYVTVDKENCRCICTKPPTGCRRKLVSIRFRFMFLMHPI